MFNGVFGQGECPKCHQRYAVINGEPHICPKVRGVVSRPDGFEFWSDLTDEPSSVEAVIEALHNQWKVCIGHHCLTSQDRALLNDGWRLIRHLTAENAALKKRIEELEGRE